jgi:putative NIF3 family GTP cyclohydrolase 1 type 2
MVDLNQIADIIESQAALDSQESWDNSGWQIRLEREGSSVRKVLTVLELSEAVVAEAIQKDVQVIVCHHPLIFG